MIRPGLPADRDQLLGLQRRTLSSPWPAILQLALERPPTESPYCFVVDPTDTSELVGYVVAIDGGPDDEPVDTAVDYCYIAEIAVDRAHRRNGYASALVQTVAEHTPVAELRLTMRADDATAGSFYCATGFEVVERRPAEYDGSVDGLLLRKPV